MSIVNEHVILKKIICDTACVHTQTNMDTCLHMHTHGETLLNNHSLECDVTEIRVSFWSNRNVGTTDLHIRFYIQI